MAQEKTTLTPLKPVETTPVAASAAQPAAAVSGNSVVTKTSAPVEKPSAKKTAGKATVKKSSAKKAVKKPVKKTAAKPAVKKTFKAVKKAVKKTSKKTLSSKTKSAAKAAVKSAGTVASNISQFKPLNPNTMNMEKIMSQGKNQFDKLAQDASAVSRENIEAVIKSSTIFAKGLEEMMRLSMSMAQNAAERQSRFMKDVLSVKTLNEFTEVQNKIAQANFEEFMSGATKITEMSTKLLNESIEPINNQFTKSIKKATEKMAA